MADAHPLVRLETFALIAVGGFAGSNLRFFAMGLIPDVPSIVLVNAVGSAVLAFLVYEADYADRLTARTRLVFTTGVLSSLTTYSTFALQTALAARPLALGGIVAANYGLGLAGVLVGRLLARRLGVPRPTGGETT
ncbi:fluoride efflux transporter FluC [Natrinema altunense]|uniref:Fluoride-specific ion channel FluC n=1 Tax=Natrinema altunense (strain JCM 12890 / CGMCC 1.3731 / AJ2) TaxID=1227494 RepID=L9ZE03_NATA2|nr:CrcB family protein [Natrinema altunense]ELY84715.1 Camphor resistance CrcB protein [Natrinema altunense JCM 12890]